MKKLLTLLGILVISISSNAQLTINQSVTPTTGLKVGDTILMGRFKNKKVIVKTITLDQHGLPLVNGKPICNFRYIV